MVLDLATSAKIVGYPHAMSLDEWHGERAKGVGGSDAGALMGESRWASPLDVYLDKTRGSAGTELHPRPDDGQGRQP